MFSAAREQGQPSEARLQAKDEPVLGGRRTRRLRHGGRGQLHPLPAAPENAFSWEPGLPASSPTAHHPGDLDRHPWRVPTPLQPHSSSYGETEAPSARRLEEPPPCSPRDPCPAYSLDGVVAGEGDEAPEGQGEGVEDLGPRIQPGDRVGQLRDLRPNRDPQPCTTGCGGGWTQEGHPRRGQEPGGEVTAEATEQRPEGKRP